MVQIDHDVLDAVADKPSRDAAHDGLSGDGHRSFRANGRQGMEARAETRSEHESRLNRVRHP